MKNTLKLAALNSLLILSMSSFAKEQSGIYMTANDFVNNKISYSAHPKIHPNNSVANLPYITVVEKGTTHKLEKSKIFGYVDNSKKAYRLFEGETYQILEADNVIIYSQTTHVAQSKGYTVLNNYFFSTKADGKIIPLTLNNLKNSYRGNEKFISMLDQFFSGSDIAEYDKIHNSYKVNYVFGKAAAPGN